MATQKKTTAGVQWITHETMASIVDKRAKAVLNISGKTFIRNRKNGKYAALDTNDCPGIVELALIAPAMDRTVARGRKKS